MIPTTQPKALYDLIEVFCTFLRTEKDCTRATLRTYRPHLRAFNNWLGANQLAQDKTSLTSAVLGQYLQHLRTKPCPNQVGMRPRTIRCHFAALNTCCEWMIDTKQLRGKNPTKGIRLPVLDDADQRLLTREEVQSMVAACDKVTPPSRRLMAKAMLSTFCSALLRRSEFLDLRLSDVHFGPRKEDNYLLVLHGKGNKRGKSLLPQETIEALQAWLTERATKEYDHDYLWVRNRRHRAGDDMMEGILEQVAAIAGLEHNPNVVPHALRHGGASNMLANGASITEIQKQLRHKKVVTTYEYLHADDGLRAANIETASWGIAAKAEPTEEMMPELPQETLLNSPPSVAPEPPIQPLDTNKVQSVPAMPQPEAAEPKLPSDAVEISSVIPPEKPTEPRCKEQSVLRPVPPKSSEATPRFQVTRFKKPEKKPVRQGVIRSRRLEW